MKVMYERECNRTNVSVKEFYSYCRKALDKKGINIEDWCALDEFISPSAIYDSEQFTKLDVGMIRELTLIKPLDVHLYSEGSYNFIMNFEFIEGNKGNGYMYAKEYVR